MSLNRHQELINWYHSLYDNDLLPVLISGDASNRKYYRVKEGILMDSDPLTEKNEQFFNYSNSFLQNGLRTPRVLHFQKNKGFFLVEDFGDNTFSKILANIKQETTYSDEKKAEHQQALYLQAVKLLPLFSTLAKDSFELFDKAFILRELDICYQWCFLNALKLILTDEEKNMLNKQFNYLADTINNYPKIVMHRDYHSRNIMVLNDNLELGLVDFQDAVYGPLGYDLASLLFDCYQTLQVLEINFLTDRAFEFYQNQLDLNCNINDFKTMVEYNAIQRLIKCLGIFNRLSLRDGKNSYLKDLPTVCHHLDLLLKGKSELLPLYEFLKIKIFNYYL
jgi:aminoglycoside/choline kinase family phosphotransferase